MRIDGNSALQFYKKAAAVAAKAEGAVPSAGSARTESAVNTDRVLISAEAATRGELGHVVQNAASEVETSVGSARLAQLSQSIEAGEYNVSADDLVNAILGFHA